VSWSAHVLGALLLAGIALGLTASRVAAAVAGLAFLWSIHAHEVVYDVACLHHAIGGVLLLASVFAWLRHRYALSVITTAVGLLMNELALLSLPTIAWYEVCLGGSPTLHDRARVAVRRIGWHAALVAAYFAFRIGLAQASLPSEGPTCHTARC